jgi:hypothetical protein
MKIPSWSEFISSTSKFENYANQKIIEFKENHPLLDNFILNSLFTLLPPPLNSIANNIYESIEGDSEEKTKAVINYFKLLQSQGEKHYNKIAQKLDNIQIQLDSIEENIAKENTVIILKNILISFENTIDQRLMI